MESLPTQTIYINNLNEKIKKVPLKKALYESFSQFGRILEIVALRGDKMRGQAWISFDSVDSATNAIAHFKDQPFFDQFADPALAEMAATNPIALVPLADADGIICTGETYKNVVKMTFAKGASIADPAGLFNSSLGGNTRRAIDIHEGDKINEEALKALVRAAVALNESSARR